MVTLKKAERFWDRAAGYFDKAEKKDRLSYMNFISIACKYLNAGSRVMDFGCGTGLVCNEIAGTVNHITAIDISSGMLDSARAKAEKRDIRNIEYIKAEIFDTKFLEESYD